MIKIKPNNPLVIFLAVAGLLLFLHSTSLLRPVENFFLTLTKPAASRLYIWGTALSRSYRADGNFEELRGQIDQLQGQVAQLTVANSRLQEMSDENDKLQALLNFLKTNRYTSVSANVLARSVAGEESAGLVIDRGSHDGLRPGLAVVSPEGVMVGQIVETKENTARMCLTTTPGCQLAAAVQNQAKTQGLTNGDLGLTIKMSYIPQLEKIVAGDLVITSGLGGNVPRGLVIGRVTTVKNESNEVWQEATIEPLADFNNLTAVAVIIP